MSVRSFRSVFMVGGVACAALSCYLVSLRVASERAAVEDVETQIAIAQRDIRLLQTEIGTRGRLAQLERWNVRVLALSAPAAEQFVPDGFTLAKLTTPERAVEMEAPVVYASAPAEAAPTTIAPPREEQPAMQRSQLMHEASLKTGASQAPREKLTPAKPAEIVATLKIAPKPVPAKAEKKAEATAKTPATKVDTAKAASTSAKIKDAATKPKPVKVAKADPLAPVLTGKAPAANKKASSATSKDSGKTR